MLRSLFLSLPHFVSHPTHLHAYLHKSHLRVVSRPFERLVAPRCHGATFSAQPLTSPTQRLVFPNITRSPFLLLIHMIGPQRVRRAGLGLLRGFMEQFAT